MIQLIDAGESGRSGGAGRLLVAGIQYDLELRPHVRFAELEAARLGSLRYEAFQRAADTAAFKSILSHGSIATIDVANARVNVGDTLTSRATMWFSLLTRDFETTQDGRCVVTVRDAASAKTRQLRIVVGRETPSRQLFHNIDQMVAMLLNRHLECAARRKRTAWFARALLTRAIFVGRLIVDRVPILARKAASMQAMAPRPLS